MIEVENLAKNYKDFPALHNTSFTIGGGGGTGGGGIGGGGIGGGGIGGTDRGGKIKEKNHGITALLGPNGAGKTTILRLITGYLTPTRGKIKIGGVEMNDENHVEIKKNIGYLPETTPLYPEMLLIEYLQFMGQVRGLVEPVLSRNAEEMVELLELGSHLYTPLSLLSKGFKQRVALAATLIHKPSYIILDEPTSGLDPNQIQHIRQLIKKLGENQTLILSTHVLQEVEDICDRVIILSRGKVVADESTKVLRSAGSCRLVVKGKGDVGETIKNIPIVKSCKKSSIIEQNVDNANKDFEIYICELKEDKPQELFKHIAKLDWELRELAPVSKSLQDVFQELTI